MSASEKPKGPQLVILTAMGFVLSYHIITNHIFDWLSR